MKWAYNQIDELGIRSPFDLGCCVVATSYRSGVCFFVERGAVGIFIRICDRSFGQSLYEGCCVRTFRGGVLSMAAGSNAFPTAVLNAEPVVRSVGNIVARQFLIKDIVLLGVSILTLADAMRAIARRAVPTDTAA
jgi:hypothetical protein